MIPNDSIKALIEWMNKEADAMLSLRRLMAGEHQHGIWRGLPNPYTVKFRQS